MKIPIKKYKKGAFIYLSGNQPLKEFYIVKNGTIRIYRTNELLGSKEEIKKEGSIVGIIQCITGIPAEENVMALTDCEIFVVQKDKLEELFLNHKKVVLKIISEYSEILRKLDADLISCSFFEEAKNRKERGVEIVKQLVLLGQKEKASHLLHSLVDENRDNKNFIEEVKNIIESLPQPEFIKTTKLIEEIKVQKDKVIFTEFENGDNFFIIKSGKVKITKLTKGKEILLAILGESDIFGEMSILNDKPRNATAVTFDDTELIVVNKKGIDQLPSPLFLKVLDFLTKRIWLVQRQIICYKLPNLVAKIYYFLASKIILELKNLDKERNKPFIFRFSLDELYDMLLLDKETIKKVDLEEFLNDKNIEIYHDSIRIKNVGEFMDKSSYLFARSLNLLTRSK